MLCKKVFTENYNLKIAHVHLYPMGFLKQNVSSLSRVRLFVTPWTVAYKAPPSMGFSRQQYWSGLPFPSPMHKSEREVAQSCPTLSDPVDCSLQGSSVHGIFQAAALEWGATASSTSPTEFTSTLTGMLSSPSLLLLLSFSSQV